jgi:hypothetical protein
MSSLLNPRAIIQARPVNVRELFEQNEFVIPEYQRDYVWKDTHVRQLWADICDHYPKCTKGDKVVTSPEGYFLGAMVALQPDAKSSHLQVIDGQQRLTTLTCLAVVLLDQIPSKWRKELNACVRSLQSIVSVVKGTKEYCRVTLPSKDLAHYFFETTINTGDASTRSRYWSSDPLAKRLLANSKSPASRIAATIDLLEDEVKLFLNAAKRRRKDRLRSLSTLITDCLVVLLIEADSSSTAYDLFEGLNYRGMPLNQADLVKNEVIKAAGSAAEKEKVTENWSDLKSSLSTHDLLSLPDFLHYSYLSRHGFIRANKLFESVCNLVSRTPKPVDYTAELVADAEALEKLIKGDSTLWSVQTNENLRDLHEVLNIKMAYIPLIAAVHKHGSNPAVFAKFVSAILNFVFRYMKIMDGDVGALAKFMQASAQAIRKGDSAAKVQAYFKTHAPDDQFKSEFKSFSANNAKIGYYIVRAIETPRLSGTVALPHGESQHLEHIMPKAPTKRHWPSAYAARKSSPEFYRKTIWRIGNLLPLPRDINSAIQNKAISWKIRNPSGKSYNASDLQSPKEVELFLNSADEWTEESIDRRQAEIAEKLITKAWPL